MYQTYDCNVHMQCLACFREGEGWIWHCGGALLPIAVTNWGSIWEELTQPNSVLEWTTLYLSYSSGGRGIGVPCFSCLIPAPDNGQVWSTGDNDNLRRVRLSLLTPRLPRDLLYQPLLTDEYRGLVQWYVKTPSAHKKNCPGADLSM